MTVPQCCPQEKVTLRKNFLAWIEKEEGNGLRLPIDPDPNPRSNSNFDVGYVGEMSGTLAVAQWDDWEYTDRGREYVRKHVFDAHGVMSSYRSKMIDKGLDKEKDKHKDVSTRRGSHGQDGNEAAGGGAAGGSSGKSGGGGGGKAKGGEVVISDFPALLALLGLDHHKYLSSLDHNRRGGNREGSSGEGEEIVMSTTMDVCEGELLSPSLSLSSLLAMRGR